MKSVQLRTGVWHDDRVISLDFPDAWDVTTYWPDTPPPMDDDEIGAAVRSPIAQRPLRELARGKSRPVIIVDDLSRPTPSYKVLPHVLNELAEAGIQASKISIVVATGTHGRQDPELLRKKLGPGVMDRYRVVVHDHRGRTKLVGRTTFGTPVHVNRTVAKGDMLIGVAGVYPQHTTGFGGGSKLSLGVLGIRSIAHLHLTHESGHGSYNIRNAFREDLAEIARIIGLHTMYTLHINANREVVSVLGGNHFVYYEQAAAFSRERYAAPAPVDADVVIANVYPADGSVFFMRKGMAPVDRAHPETTAVIVASNHGGLGYHGLFYPTHDPRKNAMRMRLTRLSIMERKVLLKKALRRLTRRRPTAVSTSEPAENSEPEAERNLWVFVPPGGYMANGNVPGMTFTDSWSKVLEVVERSKRNGGPPKVKIYPCSSLQCIGHNTTEDIPGSDSYLAAKTK